MVPRTKVFIGSLPPGAKPEELRRHFENYGVVTECDIMNRCGFVHMETQEMAENAIKALNNTNFKGSNITVEPGRMKKEISGREGSGMGGRMGDSGHPRGGGNMGRGPSRGNFGRQNSQGDMRNGSRGMINSGGGPMRRDRGGPQRGGGMPYNRNGFGDGEVNFQDRFQGGPKIGNRSFDMDNRQNTFNNGPPNNVGFNDRFGGNFGMGNQDKRGFALPDRQQFHGNMESNQSGGRGPLLGRNQRGGMGNNQSQMFERRHPGGGEGFNSNIELFDRRFVGNRGGNMNTDNAGPMFGGYKSNNMRGGGGGYSNSNNYNRSFPPLGSVGGNSNGPPRREMMSNRRF